MQGGGAANHGLTNTCSNLEALAANSVNRGGDKVARGGRKIEQNEVPRPGPQNGQFCGDAWAYPHSTTKITPYQAVIGRPYHNRIACFGQVTYGLDPRGSKYRPTWKKGIWLGKDGSDHDVLATAAGTITRTRSIRRTALTCSADEILSLVIGPRVTRSQRFFFWTAPSAFRLVTNFEAYLRTSGESNHHRKSVRDVERHRPTNFTTGAPGLHAVKGESETSSGFTTETIL